MSKKAIKFSNDVYLDTKSIMHNRHLLADILYPIGSIYITTDSTNPGTLFGGTWEAYAQGRFIMGAGAPQENNYSLFGSLNSNGFTGANGEMGGSYWHTLSVDEIPSHRHSTSANALNPSGTGWWFIGFLGVDKYANIAYTDWNMHSQYTGGGSKHNNMPPYIGAYIWKRTA